MKKCACAKLVLEARDSATRQLATTRIIGIETGLLISRDIRGKTLPRICTHLFAAVARDVLSSFEQELSVLFIRRHEKAHGPVMQ